MMKDIINGSIPKSVTHLVLSGREIVLPKGSSIRPIVIGEGILRLAIIYATNLLPTDCLAFLQPIQFGVGAPGGSERICHVLQAQLELYGPEAIDVAADFPNAFGQIPREQCLRELYLKPKLQPIWRLCDFAYRDNSLVTVMDHGKVTATISISEGVKQGCGLASILYSIGVHPLYEEIQDAHTNTHLAAEIDDLNIVGAGMAPFEAFDTLEALCSDFNLPLNYSKCYALWPHNEAPPPWFLEACEQRNLQPKTGMMVAVGAPLGFDSKAITAWVNAQVEKHDRFFDLLTHPAMPSQHAMLLLRNCGLPKFNFLTRIIPPDLGQNAFIAFDSMVSDCLASILQLSDNRLAQSPFLPLKLGQLGLRKAAVISPIAYFCGFANAVQDLTFCREDGAFQDRNFYARVSSCHKTMLEAGIDTDLLPEHPVDIWTDYAEGGPPGLQRLITASFERTIFDDDFKSFSKEQKAKFLSSTSYGATAWLTTVPADNNLHMSDRYFRQCLRLRLDVDPCDDLPRICPTCSKSLDKPDHFLHCFQRGPAKVRHDQIAFLILYFCKQAGLLAYSCDLDKRSIRVDPDSNKRPDVHIIFPDEQILVDVSVTHAPAPTYAHAGQSRLGAAKRRIKEKMKKFDKEAKMLGCSFVAFVLETHGAVSDPAKELLSKIAKFAKHSGIYSLSLSYMIKALSVRLQKGNALMLEQACVFARQRRLNFARYAEDD